VVFIPSPSVQACSADLFEGREVVTAMAILHEQLGRWKIALGLWDPGLSSETWAGTQVCSLAGLGSLAGMLARGLRLSGAAREILYQHLHPKKKIPDIRARDSKA